MRPEAGSETTRHTLRMKMHRWLACLGLVLTAGPALAGSSGCDLPNITGSRELHQFLSLRAVEVVKRAADLDDGLGTLVAPFASFNLGAGDVGRPLGTGVDGARELARTMSADSYRFLGWDYMDMPSDACANRMVEVEFIDSQKKQLSHVEFMFEAGRVMSVIGWQRSFETGRL